MMRQIPFLMLDVGITQHLFPDVFFGRDVRFVGSQFSDQEANSAVVRVRSPKHLTTRRVPW